MPDSYAQLTQRAESAEAENVTLLNDRACALIDTEIARSDAETLRRELLAGLAERDVLAARVAEMEAEQKDTHARLAVAREALEYYADPDSWTYETAIVSEDEDDCIEVFAIDESDVDEHVYIGDSVSDALQPVAGKRAREALAALKEEEAE